MTTKWDSATIGDTCEILDNLRKPVTKSDRVQGQIPYYGASGILDYVKDYIFDEKLVLLGEDGAKWGPGDRSAFIIDGKAWVNNHAHVLRPNREILLDEWLTYFLIGSDLSDYISGVTVPKLNQGKMREIDFPLPPLDEQKRIVAKLDEALGDLDQMTSHTNKSLNEIDLLWSAGLSQFFGSTPQTIEHSADSTGVNAVLGDVAKLLNGRAYKQEELLEGGKYRVLRVGNFFSSNRWYWSDLELEENKYCEDGDLLYAWSASFGPRIWIGDKTIFHYHIWKVDFDERKVVRDWLKYWFEWDVEQVKGVSGVGTTMLHVTKGAMESRKLVIPSLENQRQIVRMLDSLKIEIDQMRSLKKKATQETSQLRSSILTAAFAGDF